MNESTDATSNEHETNSSMNPIAEPREADVLCGRGGAALRHPGNQTYRRLVNANKSLYITCLKTEKLKISRSIVAAIREQQGRFLERDAKNQTWYDIGDKKAIEKTSQALREGQPKLRQKMIDTGQITASQAASMENHFGNGIYQAGSRPPSIGAVSVASVGSMMSQFSFGSLSGPNAMPFATAFQGNMDMPPPPSRTMSTDPMTADAIIQRLSLTSMGHQNPNSVPSWTPSLGSMDGESLSMRSARMRMSQQSSGFGRDHAMSIMSDFSGFSSMQDSGVFSNGIGSQQSFMSGPDPSNGMRSNIFNHPGQTMPNLPPPLSPHGSKNYDRRRLFAKMKLAKEGQPGRAQRMPEGDGMSDFHMVDTHFSLSSNLSGHGSSKHAQKSSTPDMMNISGHGMVGVSNLSGHRAMSNTSGHGFPSNFSGHESMFGDTGGLGSRRSLMSGLSKISDHTSSSVFSDLARKINLPLTSMSNRSVAMSEVSGVDDDDDSDDGEFAYDVVPGAVKSER